MMTALVALLVLAQGPNTDAEIFIDRGETYIRAGSGNGLQVGAGLEVLDAKTRTAVGTLVVVTRLLAAARIDMKKLRGGRLSQIDMEKITETANELYNMKLFIDDSGALSSFDLRAKARRLKAKEPELGLIVIDYLQLMHQKGKVESRQLEVSEISRALKQLAKELMLPVIALSQLNRKVEERKGGKPMLSDLRESGAIEQDADVVMFIHRDDEGEDGDGGGDGGSFKTTIPVELIIAKQRNGPVGSVDLLFLSEYTRFESRARGDYGG